VLPDIRLVTLLETNGERLRFDTFLIISDLRRFIARLISRRGWRLPAATGRRTNAQSDGTDYPRSVKSEFFSFLMCFEFALNKCVSAIFPQHGVCISRRPVHDLREASIATTLRHAEIRKGRGGSVHHHLQTCGGAESRNARVPSPVKRFLTIAIAVALAGLGSADSRGITFEASQGYHPGTIQDQPGVTPPPAGWGGSFPPGVINPAIDQEIVANGPTRPASFGSQSWRISNAYASGSFADMPFSPSLTNEAGESDAQNLIYSGGVRQNHFEVQYSFTAAGASLPLDTDDSYVSSSPDRGDGARMSYIRLEDHPAGIEVWFDDYQDNKPYGQYGTPVTAQQGCALNDDFTDIKVATVSRNKAHSVTLVIDFVDGPHNDVVKVYVDGSLRHVGTTWEDYYRWCPESGGGTGNPANDRSRTVDSMLYRVGGVPHPQNLGRGFLIDNLFYSSSNVRRGCDGHHGDADGDVEDGAGGRGHSRFHKDGCDKRNDDNVEHDDVVRGHHFKSSSVDSADFSTAADGRTLTMQGIGFDNGLPVGFTLVAVDHDGVVPGTYSLVLTNGYAFVGKFVNGTLVIQ
jgi:hypothetical protein